MDDVLTQEDEWQQTIINGGKVKSLVGHSGWTDVIEPSLVARRKSLSKSIGKIKEFGDFLRVQAALNAIDNLFTFIDSTIALGEQAMVQKKEEAEKKSE